MVPVLALWLPIVVAAVLVFIASSIFHMVLPHHRSDFGKIDAEDDLMEALRAAEVAPGDYAVPCPGGPDEMRDPAFIEKWTKGPVAFMTVLPAGPPAMGGQLAMWFMYTLVVSSFAAYVTGRALPPGADYLAVFRFAGTAAFGAYALALWQNSIWYRRAWSTTIKSTIDGFVYGLLTGGAFGWLWPS